MRGRPRPRRAASSKCTCLTSRDRRTGISWAALEQEFTYTFGGCTTVRGLEGNYLSRLGLSVQDRINLVYTDTSFPFEEHFTRLSHYTDELRSAAIEALDEETVLVVAIKVYHSE